jgi:hypothetical protein
MGNPLLFSRATARCRSVAYLAVILAMPSACFAWGREGHETIVIVAEHYLRPEIAARVRELLAPESPQAMAACYRPLHPPHDSEVIALSPDGHTLATAAPNSQLISLYHVR